MKSILNPLFLYSQLREKLYSFGLRKPLKLKTPVISVGNLQFGGAGKTPFVMYLLERFKKYQIAVISQSYGASLLRPALVNLSEKNFFLKYGDEASLIRSEFPQADVWCGPQKWQTALTASLHKKYDFLILDDGFSHHQLSRDLNILLLDDSRPTNSWLQREPLSAAKRADLILYTKAKPQVQKSPLYGKTTGVAQYLTDSSEIRTGIKYFLFAGIGNFDFFSTSAKQHNVSLVRSEKFANHCEYSESQQRAILEYLKTNQVRALTTTKDKIKFTDLELIQMTDCLKVRVELEPPMENWLDAKVSALVSSIF